MTNNYFYTFVIHNNCEIGLIKYSLVVQSMLIVYSFEKYVVIDTINYRPDFGLINLFKSLDLFYPLNDLSFKTRESTRLYNMYRYTFSMLYVPEHFLGYVEMFDNDAFGNVSFGFNVTH